MNVEYTRARKQLGVTVRLPIATPEFKAAEEERIAAEYAALPAFEIAEGDYNLWIYARTDEARAFVERLAPQYGALRRTFEPDRFALNVPSGERPATVAALNALWAARSVTCTAIVPAGPVIDHPAPEPPAQFQPGRFFRKFTEGVNPPTPSGFPSAKAWYMQWSLWKWTQPGGLRTGDRVRVREGTAAGRAVIVRDIERITRNYRVYYRLTCSDLRTGEACSFEVPDSQTIERISLMEKPA